MKLKDVKDYLVQNIKDNIDEAKHHQYPNSVFYTAENDGLKKALEKIEQYEKSKQKIVKVDYYNNDIHGNCPTCDYGTRYIKDMYIEYENDIKVHFHTTLFTDGFDISEGDWMLAILNSDSLDELIDWFKSKTIPLLDKHWVIHEFDYQKGSDIYYEITDGSGEGVAITKHYIGVDDK